MKSLSILITFCNPSRCRLVILWYPMTYLPFSSMSGCQAGIRQTAHPEYTICRQLLPDSTDGLGYLPWSLRVHICSLLRLHHRVLSWLWHIRSIVLLHIPMHPRRCLHNYTASLYKRSCSCCGDNYMQSVPCHSLTFLYGCN